MNQTAAEVGVFEAMHTQRAVRRHRPDPVPEELTTLHTLRADQMRAVLGIPDDIHIVCGISMGWPAVPIGPVRRRPLSEVCFWNEWGERP